MKNNLETMQSIWEDKYLPIIDDYTEGTMDTAMYVEYVLLPSGKDTNYGFSSNGFRILSFFEMVNERVEDVDNQIVLISNLEWDKTGFSVRYDIVTK